MVNLNVKLAVLSGDGQFVDCRRRHWLSIRIPVNLLGEILMLLNQVGQRFVQARILGADEIEVSDCLYCHRGYLGLLGFARLFFYEQSNDCQIVHSEI